MPYDFYLESENEERMFTQETLEEMQRYIGNVPHYKVDNAFYYIFKDDAQRDIAIPYIASSRAKKENIYIYSGIGFKPTLINLSVVGDNDVDRYLYDFVVWCQKRYPCQLYELARPVPPEELLSEEEEIPLID